MGKSSSNDELTIRNQFDRICKLALKGEAADYYRHIAYRQKHEVLFSELSQKELDSIFGVDKYTVENKCFRVLGYSINLTPIFRQPRYRASTGNSVCILLKMERISRCYSMK